MHANIAGEADNLSARVGGEVQTLIDAPFVTGNHARRIDQRVVFFEAQFRQHAVREARKEEFFSAWQPATSQSAFWLVNQGRTHVVQRYADLARHEGGFPLRLERTTGEADRAARIRGIGNQIFNAFDLRGKRRRVRPLVPAISLLSDSSTSFIDGFTFEQRTGRVDKRKSTGANFLSCPVLCRTSLPCILKSLLK